jgi:cyclic-di-GMP-binding protein
VAKESSFDVVSEIDMQEVDNAVNQTAREVATRYDLKGSGSTISLDKQNAAIQLASADEFHLKAVVDVLESKMVHRKISPKAMHAGKVEPASGGTVRQTVTLVRGIDQDRAKALARAVKESKLPARTQIEGEKLRVFAKSRDVLQDVIRLMKEGDVDIPLQFTNYRD